MSNQFVSDDGVVVRSTPTAVRDRVRIATSIFEELEAWFPHSCSKFVKIAGRMEKEDGIDGSLAFMGVYTANFTEGTV